MEQNGIISGFTNDSDASFIWTVTGIPFGATIASAKFQIKPTETSPDSAVIISKNVTGTDSAGVGQVEDDGATDLIGRIRFDMIPANSALLIPGTQYAYWVQITLNSGQKTTLEKGQIFTEQGLLHA